MNDEMISKSELIDYIYYEGDCKQTIAVLNKENLKKFLHVDVIALEETSHR